MAVRPTFFAELKRRNVLRAAVLYAGAVWALSQGIAQLSPAIGLPDYATRWFLIAAVIGFPFWIAFAWFYAWTPQGFRREEEVERDSTITLGTTRKLDFWIIGILTVAVVLLLTNQFVLRHDATSTDNAADARAIAASLAKVPDQSVAVLPFVDESAGKNQQYFSDGLSENLIIALSQFKGLKVISRDSSFQFRGSHDSAAKIGMVLGVRHLLEGSVQKLGDEVRISTMLVNVADGSTLWSQHFDRPYKDLFKLQDDITQAVTTALKTRLLAGNESSRQTDRPPDGNLAAYAAALQGKFHSQRNTKEDEQAAARYYEQAVQLDPDYAYAWAALAQVRDALAANFVSGDQRRQLERGARAAADKALALAPGLAAAHSSQSAILLDQDWDLAGSAREIQIAIRLAPQNSGALRSLATLVSYRGDFAKAAALYRRAIALDPLSATARLSLGVTLTAAGNLPAARQALQKAIALQPQAAVFHAQLAIVQILQNQAATAVATARLETSMFWRTYGLALAYQANGEHAKSDAELKQLIDTHADDGGSQIASIYAQRGRPDEAFRWLQHAVATRDAGVLEIRTDPFLARYRNDPRYIALTRQLGLMGDADTGVPASDATPTTSAGTP